MRKSLQHIQRNMGGISHCGRNIFTPVSNASHDLYCLGVQTQNWDERFPSFRALEYKIIWGNLKKMWIPIFWCFKFSNISHLRFRGCKLLRCIEVPYRFKRTISHHPSECRNEMRIQGQLHRNYEMIIHLNVPIISNPVPKHPKQLLTLPWNNRIISYRNVQDVRGTYWEDHPSHKSCL